jgi:hypothetical protein
LVIALGVLIFSGATALSYASARNTTAGVYDTVYEIGFPLTFLYVGGFLNLRTFLLGTFLFDLVLSMVAAIALVGLYGLTRRR